MKSNTEMSFLDHLEVLRWHLWRTIIAISIGAVLAFLGKEVLFHEIILAPTRGDFISYVWLCRIGKWIGIHAFCLEDLPFLLQSRRMTGQFLMHISASGVAGLILAFPYAFWELWRFVLPALLPTERKTIRGTTFVASILFFLGVAFGYYVLVPISVRFLAYYQIDPSIVNYFDIVSYVSTVVLMILCTGLVFQLPLLVYFLTRTGFVNATLMRRYRKQAVLIIFVLAALITPPDPFSQLFIALPLILLYSLSISIAKFAQNKAVEVSESSKILDR